MGTRTTSNHSHAKRACFDRAAPTQPVRLLFLVTVLLTLGQMTPLRAEQPCEPSLQPQSDLGYVKRGAGLTERCEGFYFSPVYGRALELVSLTIGPGAIPAGPETELVVTPASANPVGASAIHVRAQSWERRSYYRLDANITPGQSLNWPLRDVVTQRSELQGKIGIYAFVLENDAMLFIPIRVLPPGATQSAASLSARIRAGVDLQRVRWRYRADDAGGAFSGWTEIADQVFAGEVFPIALPAAPSGRFFIEVAAREQDRTVPVNLVFRISR